MAPPLLLALVLAANVGSDETRWDMKLGFIPGTKDDVWTGHVTLDEGKRKCVQDSRCTAITYRGKPDASGQLFVYLKADTTVSDSDKTWASYSQHGQGGHLAGPYLPTTGAWDCV